MGDLRPERLNEFPDLLRSGWSIDKLANVLQRGNWIGTEIAIGRQQNAALPLFKARVAAGYGRNLVTPVQ